jgi:hypothetical protein
MLLGKAVEGPLQSKTLCATRRFLKQAKRLGVRQPSGALQADEKSTRFPHELLYANIDMNCNGVRSRAATRCCQQKLKNPKKKFLRSFQTRHNLD